MNNKHLKKILEVQETQSPKEVEPKEAHTNAHYL